MRGHGQIKAQQEYVVKVTFDRELTEQEKSTIANLIGDSIETDELSEVEDCDNNTQQIYKLICDCVAVVTCTITDESFEYEFWGQRGVEHQYGWEDEEVDYYDDGRFMYDNMMAEDTKYVLDCINTAIESTGIRAVALEALRDRFDYYADLDKFEPDWDAFSDECYAEAMEQQQEDW